MRLAEEAQEKRKPTLLIAIALSTLLMLWLATGFAVPQKRGRGAGSSPASTQSNANTQTAQQKPPKKNITPLRAGETAEGSRVTITSNEDLKDYSAFRSGNRFYVVIPNADAPLAQSDLRGRGYEDMQVQKKGNDVVLSFRLQPGVNARVNQKFNRLEVVFSTPGAAAEAVTANSNTNRTTTTSTVNGRGTTQGQVNAPPAKRPLRKEQLIQALRVGGVSSNEYMKRIRERGVDFELTPAIEKELRAAGASSEMIEAIRANYRPPAPQIEMVLIPAGTFMMGSPDDDQFYRSYEGPQHQVSVPAFYLGKYEVTQAQYQAVMGTNPSSFKGADLPVEQVSWNDAKEFCRRLSQMTGREYRLPSEAEWEYACRAGTTGDYAGDLDAMAWYDKNSGSQTHPVGQKQPNGFGLYDMLGNVSEWCEDYYHSSYAGAPTNGSAWLSGDSSFRVLRGGSWVSGAASLRSAYRNRFVPGDSNYLIGLRVVAVSRSS